MPIRHLTAVLASTLVTLTAAAAASGHVPDDRYRSDDPPGAVYAITNASTGNAVVAFDRREDGSLKPAGTFPTGGLGSGTGLNSQGAVIVSADRRLLFAVNAGSDSISMFRVRDRGLSLLATVPSGGTRPTSLAYRRGLLYVLNAGLPNRLAGFVVTQSGRLRPLAGSERALSADDANPAQVAFSDDGDVVLVTERATNAIASYRVDDDGRLDGPFVHPSAAPTPYGFAVTRRETVLVSEAGAGGGASTYRVKGEELEPASSMIMTGQRAACWAVVSRDGRFGYVSNAGTGNITGFFIRRDGTAVLLDSDGVTAVTGSNPTDMAMSEDSRFLYARIGATNEIATMRVRTDGSLVVLPRRAALPAGAAGLAGF